MTCSPRRVVAGVLLCVLVVSSVWSQDRRGPFTHNERSVRTRDVDQKHIRLDLQFDWEQQQAVGRATLKLVPYRALQTLTLDAAEMQIKGVELLPDETASEVRTLEYDTQPQKLIIQLGQSYPAGEAFEVAVDYVITKPRRGLHFVVPDDSERDQPRMVWTQSEPEYAHYWFPCIDSPSDRLTSEIVATVPSEYMTLSNGKLKSTRKNPDGTQTWHWSQDKSHVPYLFSIVAGEFDAYEQQWQDIPIVSYVPRGQRDLAARSFEKTPRMMDFFSRKIGVKYPWSKYTQICVDEYQWGGMEHTSATTLNMNTLHDERAHLDTSSDNLVAHELIHQWYGDLLTCKDWGEIWLNESFATYFATLWTEEDLGWDEATWARHLEAESYKREDKRYRRPLVTYRYNSPANMFDGHSYPKGARILHMLRFVMGDDMFWQALHHYTSRNAHRTVETADLRIAIEDATGLGLNWFFDQWIDHGGHPEFRVEWEWDEASQTVRVSVQQQQTVDATTPLYRLPVELEIATQDAVLIRRVELSKAEETFHFQLDSPPTRVCFDPHDWLLKELDAPKSKLELLDQLQQDQHVMCRYRAARALAGHPEDKDARAALQEAAQSDPFWGVRQEAAKSLGKFKGDEVRDTLAQVADADDKSLVRREAVKALAKFKGDPTREQLRNTIASDDSYYAVADALRALEKVDREHCLDDHLQATALVSHRQVILKAAIDGLVKLKNPQATTRLAELLESESLTPARRAVLIGGLARLKPDDEQILEQLHDQLDNDRRNVKRAAIDALVAIGDPQAIDVLLDYRRKQETPGMLRSIDEAIEKLREKENSFEQLEKKLDQVQRQNRALESRLKKLEAKD